MTSLTRAQARAYLERWVLVREVETAEHRCAPMDLKVRQLAALMQSRAAFGADPSREAEAEEVRKRWARIRRAAGV
jgi:hypothetical protein